MNKYKIVLLNNTNFDLTSISEDIIDFFRTRESPIYLQFDIQKVKIPINWKIYKTGPGFNRDTGKPEMVKFLGLVDSVKDACRTLIKEGEGSAVMFLSDITDLELGPDEAITNWTNFHPLYPETEFIQIVINDFLLQKGAVGLAMKHELMHAFCSRLNRLGFSVLDEMDTDSLGRPFYKNDFPEDPDSNFASTLSNIKPYLDKLY